MPETYGQWGEDTIIEALFPPSFVGRAADVGAYDGVNMSNTYTLEQQGWEVVCIEPARSVQENLGKARRNVLSVACGKENGDEKPFTEVALNMGIKVGDKVVHTNTAALSGLDDKTEEQRKEWLWQLYKHREYAPIGSSYMVSVRTLDWCLEQMGWETVDFVNIDTEGTDMDVLEGFSIAKYEPALIFIENWWEDDRYGNYLKPFGFELVQRIAGQNELYMHKERMKVLHELSS